MPKGVVVVVLVAVVGETGEKVSRMNITSLFPRRKTIYLKILVLIPFSWMMITLLISLNGGGGSGNGSTPIRHRGNQHQSSGDQELEGGAVVVKDQNVMNKISQNHGYQSNEDSNNNNNNKINMDSNVNMRKKYNKRSRKTSDNANSNDIVDNDVQDEQESAAVLPPPRSQIQTGPGELGKAVHLPKNLSTSIQKVVDQGWSDNAFNQYVSDMISISRSLPDVRDPK